MSEDQAPRSPVPPAACPPTWASEALAQVLREFMPAEPEAETHLHRHDGGCSCGMRGE